MSSMYSGRTHLRIENDQNSASNEYRDETHEPQLPIRELSHAAEDIAPGSGREQRHQALEHQHQRARRQQDFRHCVALLNFRLLRARRALDAGLLQELKEIRAW